MRKFLLTWLLTAIALLITAWLVPGIYVAGFGAALFAALMLGFVNAIVRPILILFTLPLTIVTLGLFLLIVNAIAFKIVSLLSIGFTVRGVGAAIVGPIVLTVVTWGLQQLFGVESNSD